MIRGSTAIMLYEPSLRGSVGSNVACEMNARLELDSHLLHWSGQIIADRYRIRAAENSRPRARYYSLTKEVNGGFTIHPVRAAPADQPRQHTVVG
jgi:hypothetical protein